MQKPKLSKNIKRKLVIKLNINIGCQEVLEAVTKLVVGSIHFRVVYSGLAFSSPAVQERFFRLTNGLQLNELHIRPTTAIRTNQTNSSVCLIKSGTLWVSTDTTFLPSAYRVLFSRFQIHAGTPPIQLVVSQLVNNVLIALMAQNASVNSFSVLPWAVSPQNVRSTRDVFGQFLCANCTKLEYLHLQRYWLTLLPLDSLQKCANLRVLSVTTSGQHYNSATTVVEVFETLQQLHSLEYLEWSEPLNLFTRHLLPLHSLLTTSLPALQHWHWAMMNIVLSTTDLDNSEMLPVQPLLRVLLSGKISSPSCSTYKFTLDNYHFNQWLENLRPKVCFCSTFSEHGSQLQFS